MQHGMAVHARSVQQQQALVDVLPPLEHVHGRC